MKKLLLLLTVLFWLTTGFAQHLSFQSSKVDSLDAKTLFERITKIEKKTEKLNVFLNTQGSFNVYPKGNSTEQATFKMNQLRTKSQCKFQNCYAICFCHNKMSELMYDNNDT